MDTQRQAARYGCTQTRNGCSAIGAVFPQEGTLVESLTLAGSVDLGSVAELQAPSTTRIAAVANAQRSWNRCDIGVTSIEWPRNASGFTVEARSGCSYLPDGAAGS